MLFGVVIFRNRDGARKSSRRRRTWTPPVTPSARFVDYATAGRVKKRGVGLQSRKEIRGFGSIWRQSGSPLIPNSRFTFLFRQPQSSSPRRRGSRDGWMALQSADHLGDGSLSGGSNRSSMRPCRGRPSNVPRFSRRRAAVMKICAAKSNRRLTYTPRPAGACPT
jgi:hypothetical protein